MMRRKVVASTLSLSPCTIRLSTAAGVFRARHARVRSAVVPVQITSHDSTRAGSFMCKKSLVLRHGCGRALLRVHTPPVLGINYATAACVSPPFPLAASVFTAAAPHMVAAGAVIRAVKLLQQRQKFRRPF